MNDMGKKSKKWSDAQIKAAVDKREELKGKNPEQVIQALFPDGMKIGGEKALPLTLAHYVLLEKINSPFIKGGEIDFSDIPNTDLMNLCYIVTHSAAKTRDLISEGQEAFDAAVFDFCEKIALSELKDVGVVIAGLLYQATSTIIETRDEKKTTTAHSLDG